MGPVSFLYLSFRVLVSLSCFGREGEQGGVKGDKEEAKKKKKGVKKRKVNQVRTVMPDKHACQAKGVWGPLNTPTRTFIWLPASPAWVEGYH